MYKHNLGIPTLAARGSLWELAIASPHTTVNIDLFTVDIYNSALQLAHEWLIPLPH